MGFFSRENREEMPEPQLPERNFSIGGMKVVLKQSNQRNNANFFVSISYYKNQLLRDFLIGDVIDLFQREGAFCYGNHNGNLSAHPSDVRDEELNKIVTFDTAASVLDRLELQLPDQETLERMMELRRRQNIERNKARDEQEDRDAIRPYMRAVITLLKSNPTPSEEEVMGALMEAHAQKRAR